MFFGAPHSVKVLSTGSFIFKNRLRIYINEFHRVLISSIKCNVLPSCSLTYPCKMLFLNEEVFINPNNSSEVFL